MRHVFGPVPSRRLGRSLGIDPIPLKTCNWNCVYCQLGRTLRPSLERRDDIPPGEIAAEVRDVLLGHRPGEIDWVTIVGSGEPTLYGCLGRLIEHIKALTSLPLAVITNGSLLHRPAVRLELLRADAVLPTLDAGSEDLYRRINRPLDGLPFDRFVGGLVAFREAYRGRLWVEVMLVKGLNDSDAALRDIARVLARIGPDQVHLNRPIRPPCEPWVEVPGEDDIERALAILGEVARVVSPTTIEVDITGITDVAEAIEAIVGRHPMSEEELLRVLSHHDPGEVRDALVALEGGGRIRKIRRHGRQFWSDAGARYVEERLSHHHARPPGDAQDAPAPRSAAADVEPRTGE